MTAAISVQNLSMRFDKVEVLRDISLDVAEGEYAVLLGPSGCGKSTLLSVMGGFLSPSSGSVHLGGRDVTALPAAERMTTTMFQDYALFPHLSLLDNVAFGLRMRGVGRSARHSRAKEMLGLVGLPDAGAKKPHELSGGQRQRVALARALAVEPAALLLDEPLGALDLKLRRAMQDELKQIQKRLGTTFIHVTHDQEEAMAIADRIIVMNAGQIEDAGPPERIYNDPRTAFSAGFMGEVNFIDGLGDGTVIKTALGAIPQSLSGPCRVAIRPEHLMAEGDVLLGEATVSERGFLGAYCRLLLDTPAGQLFAHVAPDAALEPGAIVGLSTSLKHIKVYPK